MKDQVFIKGEIIAIGWAHLKILFLRNMKPEKLNLHESFQHRTKAS
jgi:hypothetical protein